MEMLTLRARVCSLSFIINEIWLLTSSFSEVEGARKDFLRESSNGGGGDEGGGLPISSDSI